MTLFLLHKSLTHHSIHISGAKVIFAISARDKDFPQQGGTILTRFLNKPLAIFICIFCTLGQKWRQAPTTRSFLWGSKSIFYIPNIFCQLLSYAILQVILPLLPTWCSAAILCSLFKGSQVRHRMRNKNESCALSTKHALRAMRNYVVARFLKDDSQIF